MTTTVLDELVRTFTAAIQAAELGTDGVPDHVVAVVSAETTRQALDAAADACGAWVREVDRTDEPELVVVLGLR